MAGRSRRRRVDPSSPLVDLDAVFADDAFIDAIAGQSWGPDPLPFAGSSSGRATAGASSGVLTANPPTVRQLTGDPLTEIFQSWRRELAEEPLPVPPQALHSSVPAQRRRRPSRSRALRPALAIAAAIAALLVGSASIGSKDVPRDSPLFALTQVLWPSRAASVASADQVGAILVEVRFALDAGRPQDAQLGLLRAAAELGRVDDVDGKGDMQQQVAALWLQAAPQEPPSGTRHDDDFDSPTSTVPRSSAVQGSSAAVAVAAPATAGAVAADAPTAAQLLVHPPGSTPGVVQAAIGAGWPTDPAVASPAGVGTVASPVATPTASAAQTSSAVAPTPPAEAASSVPSVPSTPPQPTASAAPPISDTPSATEQSPPAPTPSGPAQSVDTVTPDGAGQLSADTGAANAPSNAQTGSKVASIPLDPAVAVPG